MKKIITEHNGWPIEEVVTKSRGWPVEILVNGYEAKDVDIQLGLDVSSDAGGRIVIKPKIMGPETIVLTDYEGVERAFALKVDKVKFETKGIQFYGNEADIIPVWAKSEIVQDGQAVEIYELSIENY